MPRFGRAPVPTAQALLDALPVPLALSDAQGLAGPANAAFRRLVPSGLPWRPGEPVAALLPPLASALAEVLASGDAREAALDSGARLRILPLAEGGAALMPLDAVPTPRPPEAPQLELIGRFAGGIAHDFNNLLALIIGAAGAVRRAPDEAAAERELATVEDAAERGAALVRQLLAFARQQVLEPRAVELNEVVERMAGLLRSLLGGTVELALELEEPSRRVRVDPGQFDRALMNLAANARDAMGGRGRLTIRTGRALVLRPEPGRAIRPGRYAVLEVADTGPGMPPEVARRLFEPFFTTKLESGGTGLGLAIVKGIVEQSGGHIEVATAEGRGTCFRIFLPRHDGPGDEAGPPPPAAPARAAAILLVEDEPSLARLARFALEEAGHTVTTAGDGEEALALLEAGASPALLVSDVAMPGLDGVALARAARVRLPGLPVLLLSGYAASAVGADLRAERMRFLAKPFTPAALRQAVTDALAGA